MRDARARGVVAVMNGASNVEVQRALGALDAPVLRMRSTEGVFGGWTDTLVRASFEAMVTDSAILAGSWCCSSWYKPSGSIE